MNSIEFKNRYIAARREIISRDFAGLNDMQRQAVMATEGPLLLLAGAGSGKTTVLISRIANLIRYGRASDTEELPPNATEEDLELLERCAASPNAETDGYIRSLCAVEPVEPWRIIAITFTNKAADELKERLKKMLGDSAEDVWAMTFHSACVRMLRGYINKFGYSKSFTIYDTADSQAVMKRVLKELDMDEKTFPPRSVLSAISRAKDDMITPEDMASEAEKGYNVHKKYIARAYEEYQRRLKAADAVDFDDIILLTVRLLQEYQDVREYYQRLFKYVLIDEYQDTNNVQYMLASLLAGGKNNICVVGDDDQSIYKFRGATIENILSFENQYKGARCIRLEQNYRSTGHILGAANALIKNNMGRKGKNLWTAAGEGEKLRMYVAENDDDEAAYVSAKILSGIASGMHFKDFAVLYRMNAQSNRLEYAFKRNAIPYRIVGGTRFFDRAEIKDITSYLCVVQNPADDLRLLRIVNNPPRGIGAVTLEKVRDIASAQQRPIFDIMGESEKYPELKSAAGKLHIFTDLITELRKSSESMPLDEFYDRLLEQTGYLVSLGTSDEALARSDNIHELKSSIISFMERNEEASLAGFLDEIALYTDLDSLEAGDDSVVMMTMHSAKGLEFPWVFIVGAEDGIFPSSRAIGEVEEMEEERRLCYVAITRAKQKLFITAARRRMLFGRTSSNMISRFVDEIPSEHIDKPTPQPPVSDYDFSELDTGYGLGLKREYKSSYGYSKSYGNSYNSSYEHKDGGKAASYSYGKTAKMGSVNKEEKKTLKQTSVPKTELPKLKAGEKIEHKAFGIGTIISVMTMSGDALITVNFEKTGEKRLMLKAAAGFIKKIN